LLRDLRASPIKGKRQSFAQKMRPRMAETHQYEDDDKRSQDDCRAEQSHSKFAQSHQSNDKNRHNQNQHNVAFSGSQSYAHEKQSSNYQEHN
jgi:hypothetical protein